MAKICLVLPVLNECKNLEQILPKFCRLVEKRKNDEFVFIYVDGFSSDGTKGLIKSFSDQLSVEFLSCSLRGLGRAYKKGISFAIEFHNPDYIIQMDSDLQHDTEDIPLFIDLCERGFDVVVGSRFVSGGSLEGLDGYRALISRLGNFLIRFAGGLLRVKDCTSGFRCIRVSFLKKCNFDFLSGAGYSFQSSLLCLLLQQEVQLLEVPIKFKKRGYGQSKLRLKDKWEFLLNIPKIRFSNSKAFVKFCMVGGAGVAFNFIIYRICRMLFLFEKDPSWLIAFESSVIFNFVLHEIWTFKKIKKSNSVALRFFRFQYTTIFAAIINYFLFQWALREGVHEYFSLLLGISGGVIINYVSSSYLTWKKT